MLEDNNKYKSLGFRTNKEIFYYVNFGQFLQKKFILSQLTVSLYNGTGRVTNVSLDIQVVKYKGA